MLQVAATVAAAASSGCSNRPAAAASQAFGLRLHPAAERPPQPSTPIAYIYIKSHLKDLVFWYT